MLNFLQIIIGKGKAMKTKKKELKFNSMMEFEKKYFPESYRKKLQESMDLESEAVNLAKKSLEKARLSYRSS